MQYILEIKMEKIKIEIEFEHIPDVIQEATWEEPAQVKVEGELVMKFYSVVGISSYDADKIRDLITNYLESKLF